MSSADFLLIHQIVKEPKTIIGIYLNSITYLSYCSKYNPIERKFFCHVHRTIRNTILTSLEQVQQFMNKTTCKGLSVVIRIVRKKYLLK